MDLSANLQLTSFFAIWRLPYLDFVQGHFVRVQTTQLLFPRVLLYQKTLVLNCVYSLHPSASLCPVHLPSSQRRTATLVMAVTTEGRSPVRSLGKPARTGRPRHLTNTPARPKNTQKRKKIQRDIYSIYLHYNIYPSI